MKKTYVLSIALIVIFSSIASAQIYGNGDSNAGIGITGTTTSGASSDNTDDSTRVFIGSDVDVDSDIDFSVTGNSIRVMLEDKREATIQITSEEAKEKAGEELNVDCSDCSVQLTQKTVNSNSELIYRVNTNKEGRVLGLFRTDMDLSADVSAETGEVVSVDKPWWAFLAAESRVNTDSSSNVNYG